MIRYSSNEDATRVLDWVGSERLLEILQSARYRSTSAGNGGLWVGKGYGPSPRTSATRSRTFRTARPRSRSRASTGCSTASACQPDAHRLMKDTLSKPGIQHKFVKGLEAGRRARSTASPARGRTSTPTARSSSRAAAVVIVGLADHREGGEWLVRLAAPLHDLVVPPPSGARCRAFERGCLSAGRAALRDQLLQPRRQRLVLGGRVLPQDVRNQRDHVVELPLPGRATR